MFHRWITCSLMYFYWRIRQVNISVILGRLLENNNTFLAFLFTCWTKQILNKSIKASDKFLLAAILLLPWNCLCSPAVSTVFPPQPDPLLLTWLVIGTTLLRTFCCILMGLCLIDRNGLGPSKEGEAQYSVVHCTGYIKAWPPAGK